jgi:N-acetylglutamate synthase-like GNAT family acetyltransferase
MAEIERKARDRDISKLTVPSSLSAETFYKRLGFNAVRVDSGARQTIKRRTFCIVLESHSCRAHLRCSSRSLVLACFDP